MAITAAMSTQVTQLYVSLFNRAPERDGLGYWVQELGAGKSLTTVAAEMFAVEPARAVYPLFFTNEQIVSAFYTNVLGRAPDTEGLNYWTAKLNASTPGAVVVDMINAVVNYTGTDAAGLTSQSLFNNKVAAGLDYAVTNLGNDPVVAAEVNALVTADATGAAVGSGADAAIAFASGATQVTTTFTLTTGIDTLTGTAGNDIFNAANVFDTTLTNKVNTLGGLDSIDGGAGTDTLNVTDDKGALIDLSVATFKNIEVLNVTSVGALAVGMSDAIDLTDTGVTSATVKVKESALLTITADKTTALNITNSDEAVTIIGGGGAVSVASLNTKNVTIGDTGLGAVNANAITSASVTHAAQVDVTDNSGTLGALGSKLTTVALTDVTGAATLTGNGIKTVSLTTIGGSATVDVVSVPAHALTLNTNEIVTGAVVTDATATSVTIVATGLTVDAKDSVFSLAAAAATSVTVSGTGDVTLETTGANYTKLTTLNYTGSGSVTADLTGAASVVTTVNAATATGDVTVTIDGTNVDAVAQNVTTGSGDDTVIIDGTNTGVLATGSTLSLGAGADSVQVANGGTIAAGAVVDAGAGIDTLALSIVDSANVADFKNFELFDVANLNGAIDQAILNTANTVTGFVGTGALGGVSTIQNIGASVGFTVLGDMGATALSLTQAAAGLLTITSDADETTADGLANTTAATIVATNATSLKVVFDNNNVDTLADVANTATLNITAGTAGASTTGATTLAVVSGGSEVVNHLNVTGVKIGTTNDALTAVTVTGSQALVLDYIPGAGTLKLATVDASGQTDGGLTFNAGADLTSTGTIKLGAGDDVITFAAIDDSASVVSTLQTVNGLELGSAKGLTTQSGFDVLALANAAKAADHVSTGATDYVIKDGLYTLGSGVTTLAGAVTQLATNLAANATVVFTYAGDTFVYGAGATTATSDDFLIHLTGVVAHGLDATAAGSVYVF
jgi:trimeric autotransporter adhesin